MYSVELYSRVRRACHVDGMSNSAAARLLGIDRKTVAKILKHSVPPGYRREGPPARPKLDPFVAIIDHVLAEDMSRIKKQRHTAKRIYERLRPFHRYCVSTAGQWMSIGSRPGYHPAVLLKIYVYGYLNRIQSSRRLELETGRNVEMMWLTGRLAPDFKTIADFRRDNSKAIRQVCSQFVMLCRRVGLLNGDGVAIDGSKFKAVNNRDKNFTPAKMTRRMADIEASIERYLSKLDAADRHEPALPPAKVAHLQERIIKLKEQMQERNVIEAKVQNAPDA